MNILSNPLTLHKYRKVCFITIVIAVAFLVLVWGRAFYGSMNTFRKGESFLKEGHYVSAITFFDRSIHWYTPFNPYVEKSAEHLWEISKQAETKGDIRLALIAVRTLKRGFIAARSFYTPGKNWIKQCDQRLHELRILHLKQSAKSKDTDICKESILYNSQVKGPDVLWSIILLVGLLGWIGAVMGIIMTGSGPSWKKGQFCQANLKWMVLWIVSFSIWVFGMIKA